MNPTFHAFLRSWPFEPWVLASLLLTTGIYLRGWLALHRRDERRWACSQPVAFGAGSSALFLALASPIEPFTSLLLQVHMLQHVLLMMIAPPLFWLGAPLFPLLLGLPRPIRKYWVAPLFRWNLLRRTFERVTHPVPAWLLFTAATWFWHLPPIYELALGSDGWHYLQHICFLEHRALVLVSSRPAVSEPTELVALAADPLPDSGRRAEHAPVCSSHVLRPAALFLLRRATAAGKSVSPRRSVGSRSADVGARFCGIPSAPFRDRRPAPLRYL